MEKTAVEVANEVADRKKKLELNHITERIYSFTNEALNEYARYFEDKPTMLSVTGSGDQIFTAILNGTKIVDAFDINKFVKYYFYLKRAAILALTREEFVDIFIKGKDFSRTQLGKMLKYMDVETINFWLQAMMNWSYYYERSGLFHNYSQGEIFSRVPYLEEKKYYKLHELLKGAQINLKDGNLLALAGNYKKRYNLIYLSNVLDYFQPCYCEDILSKLKLTPNGILVAYSFGYFPSEFLNQGYEIEDLSTEHELMIRIGGH